MPHARSLNVSQQIYNLFDTDGHYIYCTILTSLFLKHQKKSFVEIHLTRRYDLCLSAYVNILHEFVNEKKSGVFFSLISVSLSSQGILTILQYLIIIMNLLDLMNVQCTFLMSEDARAVITALSPRNECLRTGHGHSIFTFFNQTGNRNRLL
jgi:hypothetical protein